MRIKIHDKKIEAAGKPSNRDRLMSELESVVKDFGSRIGSHFGYGRYVGSVADYIKDGDPSKEEAVEDIEYMIGRLEDLKGLITGRGHNHD